MANQRCRVLLGDNHAMFRQGLRALLEQLPDLVVVGEVGDGDQAIERAVLLQPDVVVLASWLPGQSVHEATAAMRERASDTRVIVLGADGDPRAMYEAIRSGALGYVPRTSGIEDLVAAIRQVADGQAALPPAALTGLVGFITSAPVEPSRVNPNGLSEREQDVLELVAQGRTNREIGEALCVAESTVRSHLHNILSKLNVANRVQAAAYARGHRNRQRATSAA